MVCHFHQLWSSLMIILESFSFVVPWWLRAVENKPRECVLRIVVRVRLAALRHDRLRHRTCQRDGHTERTLTAPFGTARMPWAAKERVARRRVAAPAALARPRALTHKKLHPWTLPQPTNRDMFEGSAFLPHLCIDPGTCMKIIMEKINGEMVALSRRFPSAATFPR